MRDWLLKLRIKNKMTQEEVAVKAEISRTTYASIEQGRRRPSVESAMRIASILDFDWTIFFEQLWLVMTLNIWIGGENMPEKQKMIDFILEIMPNVKLIVELATDDQLVRLYEQAQDKLNYQLDLI